MSNDQTNPPESGSRGFFSRFLRRKQDEPKPVEPKSVERKLPPADEREAGDESAVTPATDLDGGEEVGAAEQAAPAPAGAGQADARQSDAHLPEALQPQAHQSEVRQPQARQPQEPAGDAPEPAAEIRAEAPDEVRVPVELEPEPQAAVPESAAGTAVVPSQPQEQPQERPKKKAPGLFRRALSRTGQGLANLFLGKKAISDELLEDLETLLLMADVGVEATTEIIDTLTERVQRKELNDSGALFSALRQLLIEILKPCEEPLVPEGHAPFVMLVVGVNGVGKTTTIGKMTKRYLGEGKSVVLAAGDTFRAAAVEQLQVWGERNNVPVIAQHTGADSASVIFDAISSGQKRRTDLVIADTAGRLHNKSNLMDELAKVGRVMRKLDDTAPHEVLLVLDATTGQNAVRQMAQFSEAVEVTGIALTKLDGTAKGGVIFALCRAFGKPVRFVGLGEGIEDLQPFSAEAFVDGLLGELTDK